MFWARPAAAQIQAGDVSMNLTGVISGGYSAAYGDEVPSSHSLNFGGTASLAGYFYDPNFLTFNLSPYLNQSRADSNYQSISDASGLNFSSGIFNGSHFPGSVNYSKAYNSEGSFAIPGLPNFTTHGNSDTFGINWAENVPDVPSLSVGFQKGTTDYSVYGANDYRTYQFRFSLASFRILDARVRPGRVLPVRNLALADTAIVHQHESTGDHGHDYRRIRVQRLTCLADERRILSQFHAIVV